MTKFFVTVVGLMLIMTGCVGQGGQRSDAKDGDSPVNICAPMTIGDGGDIEGGEDLPWSMLNREGVGQIKDSCIINLDLRNNELLRTNVGLQPGQNSPAIEVNGLATIRLVGPKGIHIGYSDKFIFYTADLQSNTIDGITYFMVTEDPEELISWMRQGVEMHGFDPDKIERWVDNRRNYPDEEARSVPGEGVGNGFFVSYDVKYKGPDRANVIIVHVDPADSMTVEEFEQSIRDSQDH